MTYTMTEEEIYQEAQKRVKYKSKFLKDLMAYLIINAGIFLIWSFPAGHGYPWFLWVLGPWGLFLILDYINAFIWQGTTGRAAVEKEARKIRAGA
jgi:hypothetical protein